VEHLWAGWRSAYVQGGDAHGGDDERPVPDIADGQTLFEAILHSGYPDRDTLILWRGERVFAMLNAFPYTSGTSWCCPCGRSSSSPNSTSRTRRAVARRPSATQAVEAAYAPHGINVGANLGRGAGAGIPDHLHVHVLPRWDGDTNFMTAIANTRVMPESLAATWERLHAAWPST
jgi:ATP adenylyltransferase